MDTSQIHFPQPRQELPLSKHREYQLFVSGAAAVTGPLPPGASITMVFLVSLVQDLPPKWLIQDPILEVSTFYASSVTL